MDQEGCSCIGHCMECDTVSTGCSKHNLLPPNLISSSTHSLGMSSSIHSLLSSGSGEIADRESNWFLYQTIHLWSKYSHGCMWYKSVSGWSSNGGVFLTRVQIAITSYQYHACVCYGASTLQLLHMCKCLITGTCLDRIYFSKKLTRSPMSS